MRALGSTLDQSQERIIGKIGHPVSALTVEDKYHVVALDALAEDEQSSAVFRLREVGSQAICAEVAIVDEGDGAAELDVSATGDVRARVLGLVIAEAARSLNTGTKVVLEADMPGVAIAAMRAGFCSVDYPDKPSSFDAISSENPRQMYRVIG